MNIFLSLVMTLTLFSCSSKNVDESMANGSVSNIVYFTKAKDGSVYYALFPSPSWNGVATSMENDPTIPKKGVFIQPHLKNGLWVDGIKKDIPPTGGAFYLKHSGELIKVDLTKKELDSLSTEAGIKLSKSIQKKYYQDEKEGAEKEEERGQ